MPLKLRDLIPNARFHLRLIRDGRLDAEPSTVEFIEVHNSAYGDEWLRFKEVLSCDDYPRYVQLTLEQATQTVKPLENDMAQNLVNSMTLFHLRMAAAEWLKEHPGDPNAPAVCKALLETNPDENWVERRTG